MEFQKPAVCGTLESSDIMITVSQAPGETVSLSLTSTVEKQFGQAIRALILEIVQELGVSGIDIQATDKGALDCTIRARMKTALHRACDLPQFTSPSAQAEIDSLPAQTWVMGEMGGGNNGG